MEDKSYRGKEIQLCADGKYRWVYELNMLTNPIIFWTVLKVLGGVWLFLYVFMLIFGDFATIWEAFRIFAYVMAGIVALSLMGYLVVAAMYKGKYVVLFEMDEDGISHTQMPRQYKKAQILSAFTVLAGLASGKLSTAGAGILAATKNSSTSVFENVRKVKARRRLHLIKVNQLLNKNQVYVPDEDFDFVYDFIKSRCPHAK
jgi:hypothetical protein